MSVIRPQPGPQEQFMSTKADICIFGGAAGGGKSYVLLLEPIRHHMVEGFGAVIFRRVSTQISGEGGLWDTAQSIYPLIGAKSFSFPRLGYRMGPHTKVTFAHLQFEKDVESWQGSQIPMIGFDELTHFTERQFFYMLSRNRSACGVRPYIRATTNPDVDSWVAKFISWWIDQETGYPIPSRAGVLRYFTRVGEDMYWGDSPREVAEKAGYNVEEADVLVKSVTFIPSKLDDNQILMERDPSYKANLMALPKVDRERLLGGNWKVRRKPGDMFPRDKATVVKSIPAGIKKVVRSWDLAGTVPSESNPDPDASTSVLLCLTPEGKVLILDATWQRDEYDTVGKDMINIAERDRKQFGWKVKTRISQDPGQAGKAQAKILMRNMMRFNVVAQRETASKIVRAQMFSGQWLVGNVEVLEGSWNERFFAEMDAFPYGAHDDYPDAASNAYTLLTAELPSHERHAALAS